MSSRGPNNCASGRSPSEDGQLAFKLRHYPQVYGRPPVAFKDPHPRHLRQIVWIVWHANVFVAPRGPFKAP
jgi:hypothetical protein